MSTDRWLRSLQLRAALGLLAYQAGMGGLTFTRPEVTMGTPAWSAVTDRVPAHFMGFGLLAGACLTLGAMVARSRTMLDASLLFTGVMWVSWSVGLVFGAFTVGPGALSGVFGYGLIAWWDLAVVSPLTAGPPPSPGDDGGP